MLKIMSSMLTDRAAQRFGFTPDDLRANQQEELTERQREIARDKYRTYVRNGLIGLFGFWLAFVVLLTIIQLSQGRRKRRSSNTAVATAVQGAANC